ncbi:MAG: alpha/beta hydrolase [Saprospiraceae bacterium]|nr:alpha/beta hydrolase [Saprospiraceae bacterium]
MVTYKKVILLLLTPIVIYFIGPKVGFQPIDPKSPPVNMALTELDAWIAAKESSVSDLKPNNEAKIIWNDSVPRKTKFAVVYLHGFSASWMEGDPVNRNFAKRYGCNLYLSRLEDHGRRDSNSFNTLTSDNFCESAQQALNIGRLLGDSIILMSCSTGSTLSIMLASQYPEIHSFIMLSPNIDIKDPMSALTIGPWGSQLTSLVLGSDYNHITYTAEAQKYWNPVYHKNGIFTTKKIIADHMTEKSFAAIRQPLFMSYYYKDEDHQDDVVSVPRMLDFYEQVATPASKKRKYVSTTANSHVIASGIQSKDWEGVQQACYDFAEQVLKLSPVVSK